MELLLGAGSSRVKKVYFNDRPQWTELVTVDMCDAHKPDVVWDIQNRPLPFEDDTFDEIHAYDVFEHLSQQGDWEGFFDEWSEWYRMLKPGGLVFAISPHWSSPWVWMDPGHRRAYGPELLTFLDRTEYERQVGVTPMTDYRFVWDGDFEPIHLEVKPNGPFTYVLRAHKPVRGNGSHA